MSSSIEKVTDRLWAIRGSLNGLAGILTMGISDPSIDADDLFGLGQFLKILSADLMEIEEEVREHHRE